VTPRVYTPPSADRDQEAVDLNAETTSGTTGTAAAPVALFYPRSTTPSVRRAQSSLSPGVPGVGNVSLRGGLASCHNNRRVRTPGTAVNEPREIRFSGTLRTQVCEGGRASHRRYVHMSLQNSLQTSNARVGLNVLNNHALRGWKALPQATLSSYTLLK
jgi:hypothetical protein